MLGNPRSIIKLIYNYDINSIVSSVFAYHKYSRFYEFIVRITSTWRYYIIYSIFNIIILESYSIFSLFYSIPFNYLFFIFPRAFILFRFNILFMFNIKSLLSFVILLFSTRYGPPSLYIRHYHSFMFSL